MLSNMALYRTKDLTVGYFQRPEQNETSLAIVPKNHPVLALPHLEAEASGLLDRILSVFQEEERYARSLTLVRTVLTVSAIPFS